MDSVAGMDMHDAHGDTLARLDPEARLDWLERTERLSHIGRLAAGLAHDLNTPLASIALRAESLRRRTRDPRVAGLEGLGNLAGYLEAIESETWRCKHMIGVLQQFSGAARTGLASVDLTRVAGSAQELLAHELRHKRIALDARLDPGLLPISADEAQIRHLVMTLLVNAIDLTPAGGRVAVETRNVRADKVELTVRDGSDGSGGCAPGRALDHLICRRIVATQGGEIAVEDGAAVGTLVTVCFPVTEVGR